MTACRQSSVRQFDLGKWQKLPDLDSGKAVPCVLLAETGVRVIVTDNPGYLLQIAAGIRERGMPMRAVHTIAIVHRSYRGVML